MGFRNYRSAGTETAVNAGDKMKADFAENSGKRSPILRRRFLGWLGLGLFGAVAVNAIPSKFIPTRLIGMRKKGKKIEAIPNELAVKRVKKV